MIHTNLNTRSKLIVAYVNTTITATATTAIIISIACLLHYAAAMHSDASHTCECVRECLSTIQRTHTCTDTIVDLNWFLWLDFASRQVGRCSRVESDAPALHRRVQCARACCEHICVA